MASATDRSVTDSIRDDFLTCHICFEVFRDPRILPCLHTYCFKCICSHVDTTQAAGRPVVCPECREPITEAVKSLKSNFFINGLTDVVKEKSSVLTPCTACNLRGIWSIAEVKCLDCGDYLCPSCSAGHNASSLTWKHEKISLDGIKKGTYDEKLRQSQKIKCHKHEDKDVEFYCDACSKSICLTCVVLDHRDHKCKTIYEAVCDKRSSICTLTEKLRVNLTAFTTKEIDCLYSLEELRKADKKERDEIEIQAQNDIAKIHEDKNIAFKNLTRKSETTQKKYEDQLEVLRLQKNLMRNCVNFSDNILKKGKDEEVLMLESLITAKLNKLQTLDQTWGTEYNRSMMSAEASASQEKITSQVDATDKIVSSVNQDSFYKRLPLSSRIEFGQKEETNTIQQQSKGSHKTEDIVFRLILRNTFSTKSTKDFSKPGIRGMVYNSTIGLIISDNNNSKIKVMNKSGNLLQEVKTTGFQPSAVAVAGDIIGAVSKNFLFLFKISGVFVTKIKISEQDDHEDPNYTCLAGSTFLGFVVNIQWEDRLCFYNTAGNFMRYLYCSIQSPLAGMSITPTENIVLSEWGRGRIRVIEPQGRLKFSSGDCWWKPNGTCTSRNGTIFVADFENGVVAACSPNGNFFLDYNTHPDGISNPRYVAIDEEDMVYVVDFEGRICVYEISTQE